MNAKRVRNGLLRACASLCLAALGGCGSESGNLWVAGGITAGALVLGQAPGDEIEQVYYLGVLDPQEQLPSAVYRVTVKGQASALSRMRFASGWVKAEVIDSLEGSVSIGTTTTRSSVEVKAAEADEKLSELQSGRRLVLFGPEGFREAPRGHRLVLVMGANPAAFFSQVDRALGDLTTAKVEQLDGRTAQAVLEEMSKLRQEQVKLANIKATAAGQLGTGN